MVFSKWSILSVSTFEKKDYCVLGKGYIRIITLELKNEPCKEGTQKRIRIQLGHAWLSWQSLLDGRPGRLCVCVWWQVKVGNRILLTLDTHGWLSPCTLPMVYATKVQCTFLKQWISWVIFLILMWKRIDHLIIIQKIGLRMHAARKLFVRKTQSHNETFV